MKKMTLMAVGLGILLAGCGNADFNDQKPPTTNWKLASNVTNIKTNKPLKKGTYVICDNTDTTVAANISWDSGTKEVQLYARGISEGKEVQLATYKVPQNMNSGEVKFIFGKNMAPHTLDAQGITVNPITRNVEVLGYTNLGIRAVGSNGVVITPISYSKYAFPVLKECSLN